MYMLSESLHSSLTRSCRAVIIALPRQALSLPVDGKYDLEGMRNGNASTPQRLNVSTSQRLALRVALALFAISGSLLASSWLGGPLSMAIPTAHASCTDCTGTWYGALSNYMNWSIDNGIWPQNTENACGVENAIALVNYDDLNNGQSVTFPDSSSQTNVEHANQTSGASQWGHATPTNQWAGITNIAPDLGTDPRSIAYMTWNYSLNNRFFHDYIYRSLFDGTIALATFQQSDIALRATTLMARALEQYTEPVSATINGGAHSVVVSGVWSSNDPQANFWGGIQGIVYRDPEGDAFNTSRQEINYSTWAQGGYWSFNTTYSLWSLDYGDKNSLHDYANTFDPEPTVGPYTPGPNGSYHWYNGLTWIQRDNNYTNGQWSPDWSYDSVNGQKMTNP